MLFTTAAFSLVYLPLALIGFFLAPRPALAVQWLFFASLVFYGYWMPEFTALLLASVVVNFMIGRTIADGVRNDGGGQQAGWSPRTWLIVGITANLATLAWFKYANFFVDSVSAIAGERWDVARITLPIGISFFTFTQIAFLVDAYRDKARDYRFVNYGLFVTYFPHLIAGPILHHGQMMPQFLREETYRINTANLIAGLTIFGLGLVKKVVLADGIAPYADAIFTPVDGGAMPTTGEAWMAAMAYTLQLYFDFSGYTDMAIGLSRMFNISLPINFDSPYRATSISDFWRRWHISLSTFLRDYLYIALGGNRRGAIRRYSNLLLTMLLGGLWHGASWTFVFWGGLHGVYLALNHAFRAAAGKERCAWLDRSRFFAVAAWALTMLAVIVAWVFFRAETFSGAFRMLSAMALMAPEQDIPVLLWNSGLHLTTGLAWCAALGLVALVPWNSNAIGERLTGVVAMGAPVRAFVAAFSVMAGLSLILVNTARDSISAFIYFNF